MMRVFSLLLFRYPICFGLAILNRANKVFTLRLSITCLQPFGFTISSRPVDNVAVLRGCDS